MPKLNKFAQSVLVTLLLWTYFTLGYIIFFAPWYVFYLVFRKDIESSYQKMNHLFYRYFFLLAQWIIPGLKLDIDPEVLDIRSCVLVCNHQSYLDPILLISMYDKHKTIVKDRFFKIPIFGWILRKSGYIPSDSQGELGLLTIEQMEKMPFFLESGGNLFVFPEGTMSWGSDIGKFYPGAFKIAKRFNVGIKILSIQNTQELFPPGQFFFNTDISAPVRVQLLGSIESKQVEKLPLKELITRARNMLSQ